MIMDILFVWLCVYMVQEFKADYIAECAWESTAHILMLGVKYVISMQREFAFIADINVKQENFCMSNNTLNHLEQI